MITTVIFDIGNVLASFDYIAYLKRFYTDPEKIEHLANIIFRDPIWNEFDRGALPEEEYRKLYLEKYPEDRADIETIFSDIPNVVVPYTFSRDWIRAIRAQGCRVLFLSNYGRGNFEYALEHFDFLKEGEGGVISYQEKLTKPEPEIYKILIDRYDLNPDECVFLDDTKKNLVAAEAFGLHTIHVTSHEAAVAGLLALGIRSN